MHFLNTMTGKKEAVGTIKKINMYVCGVTPYDDAHVGHGRCYVSFDVVKRFLQFSGHDVVYCRNFTDIDDKLIHRAQKELGDPARFYEIANRYIHNFHEDITKLNCLSPEYEPRVTEHIPEIISFIQQLIDNDCAYQAGSDVYFRVAKFAEYGKLSKQKKEDLHAGCRIDLRDQKENPLDFALWKGELEGTFWQSPWGYGRPGWHIECSVLARINLGEHIDIHGGGLDLIFPHHENEIAQSESLFGSPFSRIWMHNGMVNSNQEKMSKSLGNFFFLRDLYKHFDPMVIRFYFLMHHYRMPIEFNFDGLTNAQKSYERLIKVFSGESLEKDNLLDFQSAITERMMQFLHDDVNTPGLIGVIFENFTTIAHDKNILAEVKNILVNVLGLTLHELPVRKVELTTEMQNLIDERNKARKEKNWARSDELREQLKLMGVDVQDEKI